MIDILFIINKLDSTNLKFIYYIKNYHVLPFNMKEITFDNVVNLLKKFGCELLLSEEKYNEIINNNDKVKRINIRSRCGHESNHILH